MVLLTILGVATALFLIYKLATALYLIFYPHVIAKLLGHTLDLKTLGKWAVVTGATDGIGKGYAKELAKRGINVYLISRSEEKLKATADEIRKASPNAEIRTLSIDFQHATPQLYRTTVTNAFKDLEIGILINNVGMAYAFPEELHKVENGEDFLQNIVLVNDVSALQMTRLILPEMLKRRKGAIVNISSAAGFAPMPLITVYSATKVFLDFLTRGLSYEYAETGLIFQVVNPFYVVTKMSGLRKPSFLAPDPDSYAANALDTIGLVTETSGCFSHDLQRVAMKLAISILPSSTLGFRSKQALKQISANYIRAEERKAKKAE